MTPPCADCPDDRGPRGRDLGRLGRAGRMPASARGSRRSSVPTTTCPSWARASAARSTPGARSARCAAQTSTLRLGTMVSPSSFRHPSVLAKLATTADHISGGRIELGLGTGWSEIEHTAYGFPFLSMKERMDVLEEQLEIIHDGHWGDGHVLLLRHALRAHGPQRPAQAGAAAAPAADHGRRRRPARGAARGPLRRRVQHGHAVARADHRAQARTSTRRARRPAASRSRSRS